MTVSASIHVAVNGFISFFLVAEQYSIVYMYHIFIRSSVNGHLGSIHVLTVVNSAAVNTGVHISFSDHVFLRIYGQREKTTITEN